MNEPSPRILIIDDERHLLIVLAAFIRRAGYEVIAAESGRDGIEKARQAQPDLIVCDVMMPPPNGFEVKKILSEDPATAGIPFIFLTARSNQSDKLFGLEAGADDYITKPFNDQELLARIKAVLRRAGMEKAHAQRLAQERVDTLRRELLNQVTYEIREPLTNIMAAIERVLLKRYVDPLEQEIFFKNSLSNAQFLKGLSDDVIILNNIDSGSANTFRQVVLLKQDVQDVVEACVDRYFNKSLHVDLVIDHPMECFAPKPEFRRAVHHLVDNACKYSPVKGRVGIRLQTNGEGGCVLVVEDQGPGIPRELSEKVFERFFQYIHPGMAEQGGLGIGLTIARAVARSVGGDVTLLSSQPGCRLQMVIPPLKIEEEKSLEERL